MLIYIHQSICEYLETIPSENATFSTICDSIEAVATAFRQKKHLIEIARKDAKFLSLYSGFSSSTKEVFKIILGNYVYLNYTSICDCKLVFHVGNIEKDSNNFYWDINLKFCSCQKGILFSEDLTDSKFYFRIAEFLHRSKSACSGISMAIEHTTCAGSQAYAVTKERLIDGTFCLLIVDTDKDFHGVATGSSARSGLQLDNEYKRLRKYIPPQEGIFKLVYFDVREKENLIPPSLMRMCKGIPDAVPLIDELLALEEKGDSFEILRYLDIKDGVKGKKFPQLPDNYQEEIKKFPFAKLDAKEDELIFKGVGNSIDKKFLELLQSQNSEGIYGISLEEIPQYILPDWEEIYKFVFIFACCLDDIVINNYFRHVKIT